MRFFLIAGLLLLSTLQAFSAEALDRNTPIEIRDQSCLDPRVPYFYNGKRISVDQVHKTLLTMEDETIREYALKANNSGGFAYLSGMLFVYPTVAGVIVYDNNRSAGLGLMITGGVLLISNILAGTISYNYYDKAIGRYNGILEHKDTFIHDNQELHRISYSLSYESKFNFSY